jgi:tetratricopeptide (TPR) repeat protein
MNPWGVVPIIVMLVFAGGAVAGYPTPDVPEAPPAAAPAPETTPANAAAPTAAEDIKLRIRAATDLHDQGRYDDAIALFRTLLEAHPEDPTVLCELANSCVAAGKLDDAIRYAELGSRQKAPDPAFCYVVLGSSWDQKGDLAKGEAAFRKALGEGIDSPGLRFNLGVNLTQQNHPADALPEFKAAIRARPGYASAWRALAVSWQSTGEGARAFAAYARFLTIEPSSSRSPNAVDQIQTLLFKGVTSRGPDPAIGKDRIDVSVPADQGKGPTTSATLALGMALVAASRYTEEWKSRTDAVFFAHGFEKVVSIFEELGAKDTREDPLWRETVLPYFRAARAGGHLEAMSWDIRRSKQDPEVVRWIEAHPDRIDAYRAWSSQWSAPPPAN